MNSKRFFLEFSYAGTAYHGWQRQPNALSVQEVMEEALALLLKQQTPLTAAGRTDTGVHAKQMFAHFDADTTDLEQLIFRLNQFLPNDIAVIRIREVKPRAHARFDALSRTYEYHLNNFKSPFVQGMSYGLYQPLDVEQMNKAASILLEYEDFECFSKAHTDVKTFLCTISKAVWGKSETGLVFTISANRFLRNMVRAIVGTLIEIGLDKKNIQEMHTVIESKNRSLAGYSVPAEGLFLTHIEYPNSIYLEHGKSQR
jgi:tRNA pseudouridine38-40 synthase